MVLAGCAQPAVMDTIIPRAHVEPTPPLVAEAAQTQRQAARAVRKRDDLSNADLIQMLRLSGDLQRAVRHWRAHRTSGNAAAVRHDMAALRAFTRK